MCVRKHPGIFSQAKRPKITAMSIHELGLYFDYVRTTDGNRMSYHGHAYHALYGLKISDIPKALLSNRSGLAATHLSIAFGFDTHHHANQPTGTNQANRESNESEECPEKKDHAAPVYVN